MGEAVDNLTDRTFDRYGTRLVSTDIDDLGSRLLASHFIPELFERQLIVKISLLIDSLAAGGAERQMILLANGLAARGYEVYLILYHDKLQLI